jgi:hypothetical protein
MLLDWMQERSRAGARGARHDELGAGEHERRRAALDTVDWLQEHGRRRATLDTVDWVQEHERRAALDTARGKYDTDGARMAIKLGPMATLLPKVSCARTLAVRRREASELP